MSTIAANILLNRVMDALEGYDSREKRSVAEHLLEYSFGVGRMQILTREEVPLPDQQLFDTKIKRLVEREPVQYVTGAAPFLDYVFDVDSRVLIPRPETEELVHIVLDAVKGDGKRVLDVCSGSGCIATSLALIQPSWQVKGVDISEQALEVARHNAEKLKGKSEFSIQDALDSNWQDTTKYDVIVSNPPYVLECEKSGMAEQVLGHEPHLALFVDDDDTIPFYTSIAGFAAEHLVSGGFLAFEGNALTLDEVSEDLKKRGFVAVEVLRDLSDNKRFVVAIKE